MIDNNLKKLLDDKFRLLTLDVKNVTVLNGVSEKFMHFLKDNTLNTRIISELVIEYTERFNELKSKLPNDEVCDDIDSSIKFKELRDKYQNKVNELSDNFSIDESKRLMLDIRCDILQNKLELGDDYSKRLENIFDNKIFKMQMSYLHS